MISHIKPKKKEIMNIFAASCHLLSNAVLCRYQSIYWVDYILHFHMQSVSVLKLLMWILPQLLTFELCSETPAIINNTFVRKLYRNCILYRSPINRRSNREIQPSIGRARIRAESLKGGILTARETYFQQSAPNPIQHTYPPPPASLPFFNRQQMHGVWSSFALTFTQSRSRYSGEGIIINKLLPFPNEYFCLGAGTVGS